MSSLLTKSLTAGAFALFASQATSVDAKIYFQEEFGADWADRWVLSDWKKKDGSQGEFDLAAGKWFKDAEEDKGLYTPSDAKHYSISAAFDKFSNEGKDLIIQYQVKQEKDIECGGGYIKIGPYMTEEAQKMFGDPTDYNIMFGPDKCGSTKRTHLIFSNKGKNVLKTKDLKYEQNVGQTTLYTLTLKSDSSVVVEMNQKEVYTGKMEDDWELLQPKEIDDPEDKKPSDWVDEKMIDDPDDKKPEDWVEEDKKEIVDPEAKKPEDWDDEEDGEWEAPTIPNPDYKGEWKPKRINNPGYKGEWAPKKITNPDYEANDALYKYEDFGFIGFDLWQVKGGSIFDNIIITDDKAEADEMAKKWKALSDEETKLKAEEDEKKKEEAKKDAEESASDDVDEDDDDEDDADDDKEKEL